MKSRIPVLSRAVGIVVEPSSGAVASCVVGVAQGNIEIPERAAPQSSAPVLMVVGAEDVAIDLLGYFQHPLRVDETIRIEPGLIAFLQIAGIRAVEGGLEIVHVTLDVSKLCRIDLVGIEALQRLPAFGCPFGLERVILVAANDVAAGDQFGIDGAFVQIGQRHAILAPLEFLHEHIDSAISCRVTDGS